MPTAASRRPPWTVEDYFLPLRTSRCSSKRRRLASNRRSVLSASHVSTPAALKRIMRPFCCCTMSRASATSSPARRRSFSESIYQNNAQAVKQAQDSSRSPLGAVTPVDSPSISLGGASKRGSAEVPRFPRPGPAIPDAAPLFFSICASNNDRHRQSVALVGGNFDFTGPPHCGEHRQAAGAVKTMFTLLVRDFQRTDTTRLLRSSSSTAGRLSATGKGHRWAHFLLRLPRQRPSLVRRGAAGTPALPHGERL